MTLNLFSIRSILFKRRLIISFVWQNVSRFEDENTKLSRMSSKYCLPLVTLEKYSCTFCSKFLLLEFCFSFF